MLVVRSVQVIIEEIFHEDDRFIGLAGRYFNWIGSGVVIHTVSTSDELTRVLEDKDAKIKGSNASADTTQSKSDTHVSFLCPFRAVDSIHDLVQKRNKPLPSGIHFCSVAPGYIPYSTDEHNAAIATGFGLIFPPSFTNTSKKEQADAAELSPATSHEIIGTSTSTSNGGTRTALHKAYLAIMGGESSRASRERSPTSSDDSLSSRDEGASPSKVSPASSCEEPSGTAAKHMQPAALSYTEPRDALTYHMPTSTPTERSKSPLQPSPIPAVEAVSKEAHAPAKGTHVPPQTASFPPTSPNEDVGESFAIPAGIEGVTVLREQCLEKMAICRKWASRDEGKLPPGVAAMMRMFPAFGNIEGNDLRNLLLDD